jgi:hypothetical protein
MLILMFRFVIVLNIWDRWIGGLDRYFIFQVLLISLFLLGIFFFRKRTLIICPSLCLNSLIHYKKMPNRAIEHEWNYDNHHLLPSIPIQELQGILHRTCLPASERRISKFSHLWAFCDLNAFSLWTIEPTWRVCMEVVVRFPLLTQPLWRCVIPIASTTTRCLKALRSGEKLDRLVLWLES